MLYKVPGRDIRCNTVRDWAKETLWCHVVEKIWPLAKKYRGAYSAYYRGISVAVEDRVPDISTIPVIPAVGLDKNNKVVCSEPTRVTDLATKPTRVKF